MIPDKKTADKQQARTAVTVLLVLAVLCVVVGLALMLTDLSGFQSCFGAALALAIAGLAWDWYAGPKPR